jgi:hypothetical protein
MRHQLTCPLGVFRTDSDCCQNMHKSVGIVTSGRKEKKAEHMFARSDSTNGWLEDSCLETEAKLFGTELT